MGFVTRKPRKFGDVGWHPGKMVPAGSPEKIRAPVGNWKSIWGFPL